MNLKIQIQKNIVKEILRECIPNKLKPNENFVAYFVNLLLLDPNWGVTENLMDCRSHVQSFIEVVIQELLNGRAPQDYRLRLSSKLAPLKLDICHTTTIRDINVLFKKITYYIVLLTGMGKPTLELVYLEALTALRSVMDEKELRDFMELTPEQKEEELTYIAKIVSGIRLFNKDCAKGGIGIPNLSLLLGQAVEVLRNQLQVQLMRTMKTVNAITTFVDKCCNIIQREDIPETFVAEITLPEDMDANVYTDAVNSLILFRQYELFLRKLMDKLSELEYETEQLHKEFSKLLKKIHKTVHMKIAIAVDVVFPQFEEVANLWTTLQNQIILLFVYQNILNCLDEYSKAREEPTKGWSFIFFETSENDMERMKLSTKVTLTSTNPLVHVTCYSEDELKNITLQYLGFCPWKLVKTDGALIPGKTSLGVAFYNDLYYAFSSFEAFVDFCNNPQKLISEVLDLARKKPQLINFLNLKDDLRRVWNVLRLVPKAKVEKKTENKGIQTAKSYEDIVPPYKDPKYKWNIWDFKRESLQMATITRYQTKSVQTEKTFSTNAATVQTYCLHDQTIQTKRDSSVNTPKPITFMYGLRGRRDNKQLNLDLTIPPEK